MLTDRTPGCETSSVSRDRERAVKQARKRLAEDYGSRDAWASLHEAERQLAAARQQAWAEPLASRDRGRDGRPSGYSASDRLAGAEGAVEDQPRLPRTRLDSGPRDRRSGSDEVLRGCRRQQHPALPGEGLVAFGVIRSPCWLLRLASPWTRVPRGPDVPCRVRLWPRLSALRVTSSHRHVNEFAFRPVADPSRSSGSRPCRLLPAPHPRCLAASCPAAARSYVPREPAPGGARHDVTRIWTCRTGSGGPSGGPCAGGAWRVR